MKQLPTVLTIFMMMVIVGCATTGGVTPEEKRQSILKMKNDVLTNLYKVKPDVRAQISSAPGYAVFIHTKDSMTRFVENGWAFGAQADAAAKSSDKGAAVGGELTVDNMTIYQITETGLALQATVKGTKFWKDESLN
jgi:hypothetical protein